MYITAAQNLHEHEGVSLFDRGVVFLGLHEII